MRDTANYPSAFFARSVPVDEKEEESDGANSRHGAGHQPEIHVSGDHAVVISATAVMVLGILFQTDPLAAAVAHSDGLAVGRGRAEHCPAETRGAVEAGADQTLVGAGREEESVRDALAADVDAALVVVDHQGRGCFERHFPHRRVDFGAVEIVEMIKGAMYWSAVASDV